MINVITISVIIKTVIATIVRGSCNIAVQRLDSWPKWPGFESCFCHLEAV